MEDTVLDVLGTPGYGATHDIHRRSGKGPLVVLIGGEYDEEDYSNFSLETSADKDHPREVLSDSVQQRLRQIIVAVMWLWPAICLIPPTVAFHRRTPTRSYGGNFIPADDTWVYFSGDYMLLGFLGVLAMSFCITCLAAQTAKPLRRNEVLPVLVGGLLLLLLRLLFCWCDNILVILLCGVILVCVALFVVRHTICAFVDMCVEIALRQCCNFGLEKMREREMDESVIAKKRKMLLLRTVVCVFAAAFGFLCYCSLLKPYINRGIMDQYDTKEITSSCDDPRSLCARKAINIEARKATSARIRATVTGGHEITKTE